MAYKQGLAVAGRFEYSRNKIVRILSYFQEEMMVQEDPNKLEKKMISWREEKK